MERALSTQDRYDLVLEPLVARRSNLESSRELQRFLLDVKAQGSMPLKLESRLSNPLLVLV